MLFGLSTTQARCSFVKRCARNGKEARALQVVHLLFNELTCWIWWRFAPRGHIWSNGITRFGAQDQWSKWQGCDLRELLHVVMQVVFRVVALHCVGWAPTSWRRGRCPGVWLPARGRHLLALSHALRAKCSQRWESPLHARERRDTRTVHTESWCAHLLWLPLLVCGCVSVWTADHMDVDKFVGRLFVNSWVVEVSSLTCSCMHCPWLQLLSWSASRGGFLFPTLPTYMACQLRARLVARRPTLRATSPSLGINTVKHKTQKECTRCRSASTHFVSQRWVWCNSRHTVPRLQSRV